MVDELEDSPAGRRWWRFDGGKLTLAVAFLAVLALPAQGWASEGDYSSYLSLELGGNFFMSPMYEQDYPDVVCTDDCGHQKRVWGVGPSAEVRYAPLFVDHFGVEISGGGHMGVDVLEGARGFLGVGSSGKIFAGFPHFRLFGGYEFGGRMVSSRAVLNASGGDSFWVHGPVGGVDLCFGGYRETPLYCGFNLGLEVAFERPEFEISTTRVRHTPVASSNEVVQGERRPVFRLRIDRGNRFLEAMYSRNYPAANPPGIWEQPILGTAGVEVGWGTMAGVSFGFTGDIINDDEGGAIGRGMVLAGGMMGIDYEESDGDDLETGPQPQDYLEGDGQIDEERTYDLKSCGTWKKIGSSGAEDTLDRWDISDIPRDATFDIRIDSANSRGRYLVLYGPLEVMNVHWRQTRVDGALEGADENSKSEIYDIFQRDFRDEFTIMVIEGESDAQWEYEIRCRK